VAQLLGQEAAIFLPSGTMCNQIAMAVHCLPGDEIIAAANAHIISSEGSGAAVFAGSTVRPIPAPNGIFGADEMVAAIRPRRVKSARSRLVVVEQTSNRGGGAVWPLETVCAVAGAAREHGLLLHMDGARLMNAAVATGIAARSYAELFDSVWLDLSKGLGCPVGGVLAGSSAFIEEADRWKHRFGGAMRQAGILAAAGIYALDHNVARLAQDHRNASVFAGQIAGLRGIRLQGDAVETNLVYFDVQQTGRDAPGVARLLEARGVRIGVESKYVMRAVFHLDIDAAGMQTAVEALQAVLE
jgi:threonine aldolase